MKKISVVFAALTVVAVIGFMGCAGTPRQAPIELATEPFVVDLSLLPLVRNEVAFTRQWDDLIIRFPEGMFDGVDLRAFQRVTITADYFDVDGNFIEPDNDFAMVVLVYDLDRNFGDSPDGMMPGPNSPVRQMNLGGSWGSVHTEQGSLIRLTRAPDGIVFHNSSMHVRYIEVTGITFHNR